MVDSMVIGLKCTNTFHVYMNNATEIRKYVISNCFYLNHDYLNVHLLHQADPLVKGANRSWTTQWGMS